MNARSLTLTAALLPLTACFEVIIEEEPPVEPASLQDGEWSFNMEVVAAEGDCFALGLDGGDIEPAAPGHDGDEPDKEEEPHEEETFEDDVDDGGYEELEVHAYGAWAWIESDHDQVSIDLEGLFMEGSIRGERLRASGELAFSYGYGTDDAPRTEDAPEPAGSSGGASAGCAPSADEDGGIAPPCEEEVEESVVASMDADILSSTRMEGTIIVDYVFEGGDCSVEFAFEAEAIDEDPCDCCDDEPVPMEETVSVSEGCAGR